MREAIGVSSRLRFIHRVVTLARMLPTLDLSRKKRGGNGTGPGCVVHAQLLKLQKKSG